MNHVLLTVGAAVSVGAQLASAVFAWRLLAREHGRLRENSSPIPPAAQALNDDTSSSSSADATYPVLSAMAPVPRLLLAAVLFQLLVAGGAGVLIGLDLCGAGAMCESLYLDPSPTWAGVFWGLAALAAAMTALLYPFQQGAYLSICGTHSSRDTHSRCRAEAYWMPLRRHLRAVYYATIVGNAVCFGTTVAVVVALLYQHTIAALGGTAAGGALLTLHVALAALQGVVLGASLGFRWLFLADVTALFAKRQTSEILPSSAALPSPYYIHSQVARAEVCLQENHRPGSIARTLLRRWWGAMVLLGCVRLVQEVVGLLPALLLRELIDGLSSEGGGGAQRGGVLVAGVVGCTLLSTLLRTHYDLKQSLVGLQCRGYLSDAIYRCAGGTRQEPAKGEGSTDDDQQPDVINAALVDVPRVCDQIASLNNLWCLPLQVGFTLYLLYRQIGLGFLAGLVLAVAMVPVNILLSKKIGAINVAMMAANDRRVGAITAIVDNIQHIKMCGLTDWAMHRVAVPRAAFMKALAWVKYLDGVCAFFWATTPVLVSLLSFATYAGIFGGVLTPGRVVASLTLFNTLILPLNSYPWVLNGAIEAYVSLRRLNRLLAAYDPKARLGRAPPSTTNAAPHLELCNARLWTGAESSDFHIDVDAFTVERGKLCLIRGAGGSGKSTVLAALAGEGRVTRDGERGCSLADAVASTAYLPDEPFLIAGTIASNIIFDQEAPVDVEGSAPFQEAVLAADLGPDIEALPGGLAYPVGDRGGNLSGGQRHRLAFARAVYADADLYIIDDFFGALDAHVSEEVVERGLAELLLRNKYVVVASSLPSVLALAQRSGGTVWEVVDGCLREHVAITVANVRERNDTAIFPRAASLHARLRDGSTGPSRDASPSAHGSPLSTYASPSPRRQQLLRNAKGTDGSPVVRQAGDMQADKDIDSLSNASSSDVSGGASVEDALRDEAGDGGALSPRLVLSYLRAMGPFLFAVVVLVLCAMQASRNYSDIFVAHWAATHSGDGGPDRAATNVLLQTIGVIAAANVVLGLARGLSFAFAGLRACVAIHDDVTRRAVGAPLSFLQLIPGGRLINRLTRDVYIVDDSLPFMLNIFLAQSVLLVGGAVVIGYSSSFVVLLGGIPIAGALYLLQRPYRWANRELKRLESAARSPLVDNIRGLLEGGPVMRALGAPCVQHFVRLAVRDFTLWQRLNYNLTVTQWWFNLCMQLLGCAVIAVVGVVAVAVHREGGQHRATAAGLALAYAIPLTSYISNLLGSFTELEKLFISMERIDEYRGVKTEDELFRAAQAPPSSGLVSAPPLQMAASSSEISSPLLDRPPPAVVGDTFPAVGSVDVCGAFGRYTDDGEYVLRNVHLHIRHGERVAVVGRTGSGKSSLVQLLLALLPTNDGRDAPDAPLCQPSTSLSLNGRTGGAPALVSIGGVDVRGVPPDWLRQHLVVVPQKAMLTEGTIGSNLVDGGVDGSPHAGNACRWMMAALGLARLSLEMPVEKGGSNLSQSERHLINVARALLSALDLDSREPAQCLALLPKRPRSRLVIMDEPAAHLDAAAEGLLWAVLGTIFARSTLVVVTHKLEGVLQHFGRAVVVDSGAIIADDAPQALRERGVGPFAKTITPQVAHDAVRE